MTVIFQNKKKRDSNIREEGQMLNKFLKNG